MPGAMKGKLLFSFMQNYSTPTYLSINTERNTHVYALDVQLFLSVLRFVIMRFEWSRVCTLICLFFTFTG